MEDNKLLLTLTKLTTITNVKKFKVFREKVILFCMLLALSKVNVSFSLHSFYLNVASLYLEVT